MPAKILFQNKLVTFVLIGFFLMNINVVRAQKHANKITYEKIAGSKPRNIIYILSDDHRYDFMGFTGKVPGLETPNLNRLANEGAHFQNAFVTTSLCSPSRASILTGQYAHTHTEVNNLIRKQEFQDIAQQLNAKLFNWLNKTDGMQIPLKPILEQKTDHLYKNSW